MFAEFRSRFVDCGIERGDILFVHSSMNWVGGGMSDATAVLDALLDLVGPEGTICMPSLTWTAPVLPPNGSLVDLRRSASTMGLLSERFRRRAHTRRSTSIYLPVCGLGARAAELLADQEAVCNPFGPDSTCRRIMEAGGKAVGLGVSLNTSSLSHLADYDLEPSYPIKIFADDLVEGTVIDLEGMAHLVRNVAVRADAVARYRPSVTFERSKKLQGHLHFHKWGEAFVFAYPSRVYYEEALRLGREALSRGQLPPWLDGTTWMPEVCSHLRSIV